MLRKITFLLLILLLNGCSITHKYGPYRGQVLDKETNKPIAGAVVVMVFYVSTPNLGGKSSSVIDATETLTDEQGFFEISHRVLTFRPLQFWDPYPNVKIIKPGYGDWPNHKDTEPKLDWGAIPENKQVILKLPKLKKGDEWGLSSFVYGGESLYIYSRYQDKHRLLQGFFELYSLDNYWRDKGLLTATDKSIVNSLKHVLPMRHMGGTWIITHPDGDFNRYTKLDIIKDQLTLIEEANRIGLYFRVRDDLSIEYERRYEHIIKQIIRGIYSQPHMYIYNRRYLEKFVELLAQYDVQYSLGTIPGVIGSRVSWDEKYSEQVEMVELQLLREVISNKKIFSSDLIVGVEEQTNKSISSIVRIYNAPDPSQKRKPITTKNLQNKFLREVPRHPSYITIKKSKGTLKPLPPEMKDQIYNSFMRNSKSINKD